MYIKWTYVGLCTYTRLFPLDHYRQHIYNIPVYTCTHKIPNKFVIGTATNYNYSAHAWPYVRYNLLFVNCLEITLSIFYSFTRQMEILMTTNNLKICQLFTLTIFCGQANPRIIYYKYNYTKTGIYLWILLKKKNKYFTQIYHTMF